MTFEYLLVNFRESRTVLANGTPVGVTNHILLLPTSDYLISLDGSPTTPPSEQVELDGTSAVHPTVVLFT